MVPFLVAYSVFRLDHLYTLIIRTERPGKTEKIYENIVVLNLVFITL